MVNIEHRNEAWRKLMDVIIAWTVEQPEKSPPVEVLPPDMAKAGTNNRRSLPWRLCMKATGSNFADGLSTTVAVSVQGSPHVPRRAPRCSRGNRNASGPPRHNGTWHPHVGLTTGAIVKKPPGLRFTRMLNHELPTTSNYQLYKCVANDHWMSQLVHHQWQWMGIKPSLRMEIWMSYSSPSEKEGDVLQETKRVMMICFV